MWTFFVVVHNHIHHSASSSFSIKCSSSQISKLCRTATKSFCPERVKVFGQSLHAATMHLRLGPVLMATIWKLPICCFSLSTFAQVAGHGEISTDWLRWAKGSILREIEFSQNICKSPKMHCIFGARGRQSEIM